MADPILTPAAALAVQQFAVPVAAKLISHLLVDDKSLSGQLLGTLIDKGADLTKDQLASRLKAEPRRLIEAHEHLFVRYTGWVIGELIKQAAQQPVFAADQQALVAFAAKCPENWKTFVLKGTAHLSENQRNEFVSHLADALATGQSVPQFDDIPFQAFFTWNVPLAPDLAKRLDAHLKQHLGNALPSLLVDGDASATQAWKQIIHTGIIDLQQQLGVLTGVAVDTRQHVLALRQNQDVTAIRNEVHQQQTMGELALINQKLAELLRQSPKGTDPVQLATDKDFLRSFEARRFLYFYELHRVHQQTRELGIKDSRRGHQQPPAVWDAFIFPSCRTVETPAEVIETAKHDLTQLTPPLESLLNELGQEDKRRFVLLGDPGTGKSTVIQFLCAVLGLHHARPAFDEKSFPAADPIETLPEPLRQTIPLPFILRELCGPSTGESGDWSWDRLEHAFLHGPTSGSSAASPLRVFRDQESAFRQQVLASPHAWFLIDGLDEIGSPEKRRALVKAIQEGMLKYPQARWLITSRIVGYNEAPVDRVRHTRPVPGLAFPVTDSNHPSVFTAYDHCWLEMQDIWQALLVERDTIDYDLRFLPSPGNDGTPAGLSMSSRGSHDPRLGEEGDATLEGWSHEGSAPDIAWANPSGVDSRTLPVRRLKPPAIQGEPFQGSDSQHVGAPESLPEKDSVLVDAIRDISGKPYDYVIELRRPIAHVRYLAPFDNTQRRDFLLRWFTLRGYSFPDKTIAAFVDQQIGDIDQREAEGVRLLSRIPNMLSYMAVLVRDGTQLPDGRAKLYHAIAHAYLDSLDFEHRHLYDLPAHGQPISRDRTPPVTPEQARHLLRRLAIALMQRHGSVKEQTGTQVNRVTADQALIILRPLIDEWLKNPVFAAHHAGCDQAKIIAEVLHYLSRRSGLIVEVGPKEHGFVHLSFLEFFAAEWLSEEVTRLKNRNARRGEAGPDGPPISETELDVDFPPPPDYAYGKEDLRALTDRTSWRETLIFLAELRADPDHGWKDCQRTLVRWLFPPLIPTRPLDQPPPELAEAECQLTKDVPLSFAAAALAIRISQDPAIALDPSLCQHWWTTLWLHRLRCERHEGESNPEKAWHLAPELLARQPSRAGVIRSLDIALQRLTANGTRLLMRGLYLGDCTTLCIHDLTIIRHSKGVERLYLDGSQGLRNTVGLPPLPSLKKLSLRYCTSLEGADALRGLAGLDRLEHLDLQSCIRLRNTDGLPPLPELKELNLENCVGLEAGDALRDLAKSDKLHALSLSYCFGLRSTAGLPFLPALALLNLRFCTGLEGEDALCGLAGLDKLLVLDLTSCTGLCSTVSLPLLPALKQLSLSSCTGLEGEDALRGLVRLDQLEFLYLNNCTRLKPETIAAFRNAVGERRGERGPELRIIGP